MVSLISLKWAPVNRKFIDVSPLFWTGLPKFRQLPSSRPGSSIFLSAQETQRIFLRARNRLLEFFKNGFIFNPDPAKVECVISSAKDSFFKCLFYFFYQIVMTQQLNLRLRYNFNLMGNRQYKKPEHAVVAVTEGLLDIMNREENDEIVLHPPAPGRSNCTAQRHPATGQDFRLRRRYGSGRRQGVWDRLSG